MRRTVRAAAGILTAAVIAIVMASCDDDDITGPVNDVYVANLSPANEVPVKTTTGTGVTTFVDLGTSIEWTMTLTPTTSQPRLLMKVSSTRPRSAQASCA